MVESTESTESQGSKVELVKQEAKIQALVHQMEALQLQVRRQQQFVLNAIFTPTRHGPPSMNAANHPARTPITRASNAAIAGSQQHVWHLYTTESDVGLVVGVFTKVVSKVISKLAWG